MTRIDPILPNIYRISVFNPHVGITFNQFLVVDEKPALIHTGTHPMYAEVRKAAGSRPSSLPLDRAGDRRVPHMAGA